MKKKPKPSMTILIIIAIILTPIFVYSRELTIFFLILFGGLFIWKPSLFAYGKAS